MAKKLKLKLIKTRESYSTRRLAQTLDVHIRTIQEWKTQGLKPLPNTTPLLFMGFEVKNFLQERQKTNKVKLQKNQFYCVKCRKAVSSKDNKVLLIETQKLIGKEQLSEVVIKGNCEFCGCKLNRFSHIGKLPEIKESFNVVNTGNFENE